MKKRIIAAALLATVSSFSTLAAEQVSKQEISTSNWLRSAP